MLSRDDDDDDDDSEEEEEEEDSHWSPAVQLSSSSAECAKLHPTWLMHNLNGVFARAEWWSCVCMWTGISLSYSLDG